MTDTLAGRASHLLEVKHSRFLAQAAPVATPDDALAFLREIAVPDATHNCWAYRIGGEYRSSDDGEPAGTAGRPILAAIDGQGFDRVMVVVTRWYGGIKLGAGGLVRAYTDAVAQALLAAKAADQFKPLQRMASLTCSVPYALEGWVRREVQAHHATLLDVSHTSVVTLHMTLPESQAAALVARLNDGGQGHLAWISAEQNTP